MGEHLRRARLDRGLRQKDVAQAIGVNHRTYEYWETGRTRAMTMRHLPMVLAFLGYDPRPKPETFGGRIHAAREGAGLSAKALARQLGLDQGTVTTWERDEVQRPYPRIRRLFERYLAAAELGGRRKILQTD